VGSNPGTIDWMDVSDASYYIHENKKNKGSQMGHTKKNNKNHLKTLIFKRFFIILFISI
jgi:hypothetical protein